MLTLLAAAAAVAAAAVAAADDDCEVASSHPRKKGSRRYPIERPLVDEPILQNNVRKRVSFLRVSIHFLSHYFDSCISVNTDLLPVLFNRRDTTSAATDFE